MTKMVGFANAKIQLHKQLQLIAKERNNEKNKSYF